MPLSPMTHLRAVSAGRSPAPLDRRASNALTTTVLQAASSRSLEHSSHDLARLFAALLAHRDLEHDDLLRLARLAPLHESTVLAAFLLHPSTTPDLALEALWSAALARASSCLELAVLAGTAGRAATSVLASASTLSYRQYRTLLEHLLEGGSDAVDVFVTLTSDDPGPHSYEHLHLLVEVALSL